LSQAWSYRLVRLEDRQELWVTKLPYTATAMPMPYQGKSGKQYVEIISASGGPSNGAPANSQSLIVFASP
jgi:glucose dehydrogenase